MPFDPYTSPKHCHLTIPTLNFSSGECYADETMVKILILDSKTHFDLIIPLVIRKVSEDSADCRP